MTFGKRAARCIIGVNGSQIEATAIFMYPEAAVRAWQGLIANARAELGGSGGGGGIGFFGSAEWALGGAALMGLLNAASSNAKAKKALGLLKEAETKQAEISTAGVFVDVPSITNIQIADPLVWVGSREKQADVSMKDVSLLSRGNFLRSHGLSKDDVRDGKVSVATTENMVRFEHEFVTVGTAEGEVAIRWSAVASYRLG